MNYGLHVAPVELKRLGREIMGTHVYFFAMATFPCSIGGPMCRDQRPISGDSRLTTGANEFTFALFLCDVR
jgi:hypothetical protein